MFVGVHQQKHISDYYKVWINQGGITVVGYVSRESTMELAQMWSAPFEGDSAGNGSKVAAFGQDQTGSTSVTKWNSSLIWDGAEALKFPLKVHFLAYSDAKLEVDDPVRYLSQFSSPELSASLAFGQRPMPVSLNIGQRIIIPSTDKGGAFIHNVGFDYNAPITTTGYFAENTVDLVVSTDSTLSRSEIPNIFK